jgi:acyl carrier protein
VIQKQIPRASIKENLAEYIAREILKDPQRSIENDEPLITSGLVDSFYLVDLALFIEDDFQVRLDDTELSASIFDTLEELAELVFIRQGSTEA